MAEGFDRPTSMSNASDTLSEILRTEHVHRRTAQVGYIIDFDPTCQTATVQVGIMMNLNGDIQPIEPLLDVPVIFPSASGRGLTFPIRSGDQCLIVFADRAIGKWLNQGGVVYPDDTRIKHLSDAICIPGLPSCARPIDDFDNSITQLSGGGSAQVKLDKNCIEIHAAGHELLDVLIDALDALVAKHPAVAVPLAKLKLMKC